MLEGTYLLVSNDKVLSIAVLFVRVVAWGVVESCASWGGAERLRMLSCLYRLQSCWCSLRDQLEADRFDQRSHKQHRPGQQSTGWTKWVQTSSGFSAIGGAATQLLQTSSLHSAQDTGYDRTCCLITVHAVQFVIHFSPSIYFLSLKASNANLPGLLFEVLRGGTQAPVPLTWSKCCKPPAGHVQDTENGENNKTPVESHFKHFQAFLALPVECFESRIENQELFPNTLPHLRQWCFRRSCITPKRAWQFMQTSGWMLRKATRWNI